MNLDINLKFNEFNEYLNQRGAEAHPGKDKLETLTHELVIAILKSKKLDVDKELAVLANIVKRMAKSRLPGRIKIMLQAERILKACEQKGLKTDFSSEVGRSIQTLKAKNKGESLLEDIDDKKLGFIHGDTFLSASGLEGGSPIHLLMERRSH